MSEPTRSVPTNLLLDSLAAADRDYLLPRLRRVELLLRAVLHAPGEPITSVYFPLEGYASMIATLEGGDSVEVGLIGFEGMVGLPVILGTDRSLTEALVQGEGFALQADAEIFRNLLNSSPSFRDLMLRYAMAFNTQITMTAACNGRHLVEQRLARWLLMADDRARNDGFPMTHEFLSLMLGVRRSGVSVAAGALQRAGLIRYEQGRMRVTDRNGLEEAACECHHMTRKEYDRLLPSPQ